jgi:hypothetical protein
MVSLNTIRLYRLMGATYAELGYASDRLGENHARSIIGGGPVVKWLQFAKRNPTFRSAMERVLVRWAEQCT